jgi:hypothetical protein
VNEVLGKITAFLTARVAYEKTDSTKNRMAKDAAKTAMREFANGSLSTSRKSAGQFLTTNPPRWTS